MAEVNLASISGEWAVIFEGEVVAHSKNLLSILKETEDYPEGTTVTKVLSGQACFY